mgnify:CR=1 FL=1
MLTESISLKGSKAVDLNTSTTEGFLDFLDGVPMVTKSALNSVPPMFRALVHNYAGEYKLLVEELQILMREL